MKTVIEIVPATPGMVNIIFDDSTSLAANQEIVSHYEIEVSRIIDEATLGRIIDEADGGRCYEAALRYIESRARSADELKHHLLSRHLYSTAAIEHALNRLKQNGLLDDASFAKAWVEDRIQFNPKSRLMLQRELRQKGISPTEIATALSEIDALLAEFALEHKTTFGVKLDAVLNPGLGK